jgi:MOSC domain-containing protein YiiM
MKRGRIEALFVYPLEGGPAESRTEVRTREANGLEEDHRRSQARAITLLSLDQWAEVQSELGAELPPETRRSNVMVSGIDLPSTVGQRLRLGEVEIEVKGEVRPCEAMDQAHQGLRATLARELRGGVHGRILHPGVIRRGDPVEVIDEANSRE